MKKRTSKPRIGRPPLPKSERRTELIKLRATSDETAALDALAEATDTDRSRAIRIAVEMALDAACGAAQRHDLVSAILRSMVVVDLRDGCNNVVPMYQLRGELFAGRTFASRADVSDALRKMEHDGIVELLPQHKHTLPQDWEAGVDCGVERGVACYVRARPVPAISAASKGRK